MQSFKLFLVLALVAMSSSAAVIKPEVQQPQQDSDEPPILPGPRIPKSPQNGQITVNVDKQNGGTSWSVEGSHKVWSNDHGSISINGGVNHPVGGETSSHVGISGTFEWRKAQE